MPIEECIALCDDVFDQVKGHPTHEAGLSLNRGFIEALRGNFAEARSAVAFARSVWTDLGVSHALVGMTEIEATVERYAGDIQAEERIRRSGYDSFVESGADGYTASWAAGLARPLIELGRDEEALSLTLESERLAAVDDITAQIPWRVARARVLARRGDFDEAERLGVEATAMSDKTDWVIWQGDSYMALADVLRLRGRADRALASAQRAVELYGGKGNVVAARWARDLLQQLGPDGE